MSNIKILYRDEDRERFVDKHPEGIINKLESKIEQLNETLKWKNHVEGCRPRFHNVIECEKRYFAEILFHAEDRRYRALCAWVPAEEVFVLLSVFQKERHYQTSKQHDILKTVESNPSETVDQARDIIQNPSSA